MWSVWSRRSETSSSLRMVSGWQSIPRFPAGENAHLGGEEHLVALALQRLADLRFVMAHAIEAGGVEMVVADLDRAIEQAQPVLVAGRPP
jgi:hypothetical protein